MKEITPGFIILFLFAANAVLAQDLLYLDGSGAVANLTIQSGTQLYVEGGFVANSISSGMEVDGELYLKDGSSSTSSHWTDNTAGGAVLNTSSGTVYLGSALQQNVTGTNTTFYNLVFNSSSANIDGIRLQSNISVSNQVDFRDGLVYANSNSLLITNNAANAITFSAPNNSSYSQSWVAAIYPSGKLDRQITNNASVYAFPVGSTAQAQLLEVIPTSIPGISRFSASWENSVTGTTPLSISECGTTYMIVNSGGEWHLRPANGGTYGSGSFSGGQMTLNGHNLSAFSGLIDNQFAILVRSDGNTSAAGWSVPAPSCTSLSPFNAAGRTVASDYAARNNLTSWSDATSQMGIGSTNVPLPIELLSFTGWNEGNVNELMWVTSSELNSNHFEIEKSLSGNDFMMMGTEKAAGFSTSSLTYHFIDYEPAHGFNYYRLKMVDNDETFKYSNVVIIKLAEGQSFAVSLFPNPTDADITLQVESGEVQNLILELTDELGRIIYSNNLNIPAGNYSYTIGTGFLPNAVYFLHIVNSQGKSSPSFKIIKLK